jgi:hypothetical protein
MRQGRFEITPELLAQIKEFEIFVGGVFKCKFTNLQLALTFFIQETGGKIYRTRGIPPARSIFLQGCYWKVYYKNDRSAVWSFWQIMTATKKYQKNISFQKLQAKRIKEANRGRLRRLKKKKNIIHPFEEIRQFL